ncbi:glycosyltransferase family 2 protein [Flavobacterium amniphilum]|uniref:glycosyltransferase family 2 protein n=1 Tax=Flavobacterium amniphilum TaxID=1834035 RepID=UPI00202A9D2D|nr:glycosyltransferase family 2 protein [Flavobacterium amniphilum]MCL9805111.1 glycosyltransferase family 2 protein [Flavobacterium amniphilum]
MLAIVIPYYNSRFFEKTIHSLASQTDKRFHVYIGDDASPDDPNEVVVKYQNEISIHYTRFASNLGSKSLVKQWERSIGLTQNEEWIMVLGDDDILQGNCVAKFYENLDEIKGSGSKVVRYASQYIDENDALLKGYEPYFHPKTEKSTDSYFKNFLGESRSSLSEHIFSKKAYESILFYDFPLAWHSDDRAWLEFTEYQTIFTINEAMVSVRVSKNSITGKKDNVILKNEATLRFFEFLISEAYSNFKSKQQSVLILEYAHKLKLENKLKSGVVIKLIFKLIKNGSFVSALKLFRRYFRFRFLKK